MWGGAFACHARAVYRSLHWWLANLLGSAATMACFAGASCGHFVSDQFTCGVSRDDDGQQARFCDQPGESCICATHRCAIADGKCESRLRYHFGDEDCVAAEHAKTSFRQFAGGASFCPGYGPQLPCGLVGGTACRQNEACVCTVNQCAGGDGVCPSGYRFIDSLECVDPGEARPEVLVFAQGGDGSPSLCPGQQPLPPPCGVPLRGESPVACGRNDVCVCANARFRCAFTAPGCSHSGFAWSFDARCIDDLTSDEIRDPTNQPDMMGICPQYAPMDAGADTASMDASPDTTVIDVPGEMSAADADDDSFDDARLSQ
jgi:hypothetical protein